TACLALPTHRVRRPTVRPHSLRKPETVHHVRGDLSRPCGTRSASIRAALTRIPRVAARMVRALLNTFPVAATHRRTATRHRRRSTNLEEVMNFAHLLIAVALVLRWYEWM